MSEVVSLEAVLEILRAMHRITAEDPIWLRRGRRITILYEFEVDGELRSFRSTAEGSDWSFTEGTLSDDECNIVLRTDPAALYEVLHGVTGGREAMLSGRLSMRKDPEFPDLLLMRAMFNRYTKAKERGVLNDLGVGDVPESLVLPKKVGAGSADGDAGNA
ncbi:hypothetical protein [Amycolatopsis samaneae]|uniref:SCP2 domain-containing protein n=1 Tax=Amycolatopsis samaneae TaxID=664691 RepID=A0ABW5GP73_9PSEU